MQFPVGLLTAMSATGESPSFENDYGRAEIGKPWESMIDGPGPLRMARGDP